METTVKGLGFRVKRLGLKAKGFRLEGSWG